MQGSQDFGKPKRLGIVVTNDKPDKLTLFVCFKAMPHQPTHLNC